MRAFVVVGTRALSVTQFAYEIFMSALNKYVTLFTNNFFSKICAVSNIFFYVYREKINVKSDKVKDFKNHNQNVIQ